MWPHRAGLTGRALEAKAAVCSPDRGVVGASRALLAADRGASAEAAYRAFLAAARANGCIQLPRRAGVATCTRRTLSVLPWEAREANHARRTVVLLTDLAVSAAWCRPRAFVCDGARHEGVEVGAWLRLGLGWRLGWRLGPGSGSGSGSGSGLGLRRAPNVTRHILALHAGIRPQRTLCQHTGFAAARSQGPVGSLGHKVGYALEADGWAALTH